MNTSSAKLRELTEAAASAVAREIATLRREAQQERDVRDAEHRARMAELESIRVSITETERQIKERLASLKDGRDGVDGKNGSDGAGVTSADVEPLLREMVAAIPVPKDGNDGRNGSDGKDGRDGIDADPEAVRLMVVEAVAAIPAPKDGRGGVDGKDGADGRSVTIDDVMPLLEARLAEHVAAIPVPKDGKDGRDGVDGRDGSDGKDGERGLEGQPGKLPIIRSWEDRVYYEGDTCSHDGATYQASRDTGRAPPHEDWTCIAAAGRNGVDGRSFTIRGTYAEGVDDYRGMDVVALNGAAFIAKRDDPGPCPGDGWQLIASQGKQGKPGERGQPGQKGDRGEPGPAVVSVHMDDEGLFRLTNADGSVVDADFYGVLSRLG